jgi:hypothetical protein
MADEFGNRNAPEVNSQVENKIAKENVVALENKPVSENIEVKENLDTVGKPKQVNKNAGKKRLNVLSAGLVGVVSFALIGVTSLVNVKMKAEFDDKKVAYEEGKISYTLSVKEMTEKETLSIYVIRDNVRQEKIELKDEDGDGLIEGKIDVDKNYLDEKFSSGKPETVTYKLDLKGVVGLNVERYFDSVTVTIDQVVSEFYYVEGHCNCGSDGYYYFTMVFDDIDHIFSNFEAYIVDDYGNKAICKFSDNLYDEQKIYVADLVSSHGKLVIKYTADDGETEGKDEFGFYTIETDINM